MSPEPGSMGTIDRGLTALLSELQGINAPLEKSWAVERLGTVPGVLEFLEQRNAAIRMILNEIKTRSLRVHPKMVSEHVALNRVNPLEVTAFSEYEQFYKPSTSRFAADLDLLLERSVSGLRESLRKLRDSFSGASVPEAIALLTPMQSDALFGLIGESEALTRKLIGTLTLVVSIPAVDRVSVPIKAVERGWRNWRNPGEAGRNDPLWAILRDKTALTAYQGEFPAIFNLSSHAEDPLEAMRLVSRAVLEQEVDVIARPHCNVVVFAKANLGNSPESVAAEIETFGQIIRILNRNFSIPVKGKKSEPWFGQLFKRADLHYLTDRLVDPSRGSPAGGSLHVHSAVAPGCSRLLTKD